MPRTTANAVKAIIEVDSTIGSLDPFIEAASSLVDDCCITLPSGDPTGYTDAKLELIERWLAAHFYALRDPRLSSESAGPVSASYQYRVDLGLQVTTYGQQALQLDVKGGLAILNKNTLEGRGKMSAGISWLGTKKC